MVTLIRQRKALLGLIVVACGVLFFFGCTTTNPHYNPNKKHHTTTGFTNNYGPAGGKPLSELIRWNREAFQNGLPKPPSTIFNGYSGVPIERPALELLARNKQDVTVTWVGHATLLVQMAGLNILTDPHFSERASPVSFAGPKRKVPVPVQLSELPRIDLVLISHNHYDHLDIQSIEQLRKQPGGEPLFVVPLGIDRWLSGQGVKNIKVFDWWDSQQLLGVQVDFVPAQHWSSRSPFDRNASLWGGWVVQSFNTGKPFKMYFAGDTGYSKDFVDIGAKFGGFDLSLLPVGAYEPRWFMKDQHVNPDEAVQVHRDVQSKVSVGIHWGTFELTDESLDQPIIDLAAALKSANIPPEQFVLFKHGQTRTLLPNGNFQ
jgi:N-acyl-phosphatidylethanolamine-hydrolysing phospholipase D